MSTVKVSSAGQFGSRYGVRVRRNFLSINDRQTNRHECPSCGASRVRRLNRGVFSCLKCNVEFTGGAFLPETLSGTIVAKMIQQKTFTPPAMGEQADIMIAKQAAKTAKKPAKVKRVKKEKVPLTAEETTDADHGA